MHPRGVAEEEIPCPRSEQGRRETAHIAVNRGQHGVFQIMPPGIQPRGIPQPSVIADENVVHTLVGEIRVSGFGQIRPRRPRRDSRRERQSFRFGAEPQNQAQSPARGGAEHADLLCGLGLEQFAVYGHGVVDCGRIGEFGSHPVIGVYDPEFAYARHQDGFLRS